MTATVEAPTDVIENGVHQDLPVDDYHAHRGSLSSSGARKLLPPSCPALYRWELDHPREPKAVFDVGHGAHKLVLGDGPPIATVDAPDWRTKAAREQRDEAYAAGAIPLLAGTVEQLHAMADAIREHPLAAALLDPDHGRPEQSIFWTDERTGVQRRARLDWMPDPVEGRLIVPDYKTARSSEPTAFARAASEHGYHQQDDWYREALRAIGYADDASFVFIVQEKQAPYLVTVVELDVEARRIGRLLNDRALDVYAECVATDRWPGYADDVELVALPAWYTRPFEETR